MTDKWGVALGNMVLTYRWFVIFLSFMLVFATGYGVQFIGFDTNYRVFFGDENPQLQAFDELQNVYTKTDNTMYVIKPKAGDAFQPQVLELVQYLTEQSWQLPYSTRVDSLSNFQYTSAQGDDLTVADLIEGDPNRLSNKQLSTIRDIALHEPLLAKRLISPDGKTTGVNIVHNFPGKTAFEVPEAAAKAREILTDARAKYPEIEIRTSGMVFMNNAFSEASQNDMATLIPIMYGVLLVTMLLFLRSVSATFTTLLVIAFSAITAMGIAGWFGVKLTPPSANAPTIILTLAIADSIHIIVSMLVNMRKGMAKHAAIIESLRINLQPIFLTSMTTAIGFLTLNFSDAPPFHDLGNMTATGVIAAFVYSILFLPALLSVLPIRCKLQAENKETMVDKLGQFVVSYRRLLLPLSTGLVIVLALMIPRIELNDEFVKYFDDSIEFRTDTDFMLENLTGIYNFEYSLGAGGESQINNPQYLQETEKFANWLRQQPEVMHVYSITDIFKRLNKNMHGDDPSWYRIPDTKEMAAQYLLLYEFSLPYGLDLNDRINIDKSASRLSATLHDLSTVDIRNFKDRSEAWMLENLPDYMQTQATSPIVMFSYISQRNIESMAVGNIVALIVISLIILIALKSIRMGAISLVPNLVPVAMGLGIWGLLISQINMAVAVVAAVSLGIIVDDTVHFLSKYHRARREKNYNAEQAVQYAFSTVGSALIITTFILIAGFGILILSSFQMNVTLGLLTAIMIGCALIADFFLLPPLLIAIDRTKKTKDTQQEESL
ncbi:MAG: MMPL family transporter [Rickettsiales bacterium]|nr:MMPL family transporter [Rickettsiales bacterium]